MTDEEPRFEGDDAIREARRLIAEAARVYHEGFEHTRGLVVTGVVLVMEGTVIGGNEFCLNYLCGNGAEPTEQDSNGLPSWRVGGMLSAVIRQSNYAHDSITFLNPEDE